MSTIPGRPDSTTRSPRAVLEYVTMPNCRDCSRLERQLSAIRGAYPDLEITEIAADSIRGRQASIEQGVLRFPVVLLNGEIVAIESIDDHGLRRLVDQATAS